MRNYNSITPLLFVLLLLVASGCGEGEENDYDWEWEEEKKIKNQDKPRFIWIDAAANFPDFANSRENIARDLALAKEAGFTDIVVDVRPTSGDVLFETDVVDQVKWLGAWLSSGYSKIERTATWDYLQAFIDEGHALGLKVHAGINTFSGAVRTSIGAQGMLYRESNKKEWATSLLTENGIVNTMDLSDNGAVFFNPSHEEVQAFLLDLLADLAAYEELDGIILDRGRYDGLDSDFSDLSRTKFEDYLGFSLSHFPEEVMTYDLVKSGLSANKPDYFHKWLEYRVKVIHDFMEKARTKVKSINPKVQFGVYVGAWYSVYYNVGVNWGSPDYNIGTNYSWATANYKNYGYADHMDIIIIGAYAAPTRVFGNNEWTIQGFCSQAMNKVKGDALVVGGPDIGNGEWANTSDELTGKAIVESVAACMDACDGYFLFDMIHLKQKGQWGKVKEGIDLAISE
ncbi:alpha amylase family protein [Echinicola shivajiensis]|uniref:alpha amylase family protein n=1 Tax=Echinicola shivajiensis TaxID=1035916 RepID=UPI001BFCBFD1|nr:alpha amylase family protein [Echinicola shivajiensis]